MTRSMERIDPKSLEPGQALSMDLFSQTGVKLLSAGTPLTPELWRMLIRSHRAGVYLAKRFNGDNDDQPMFLSHDDPEREARRARARRMREAESYTADRARHWERLPLEIEISPISLVPRNKAEKPWPRREALSGYRRAMSDRLRRVLRSAMLGSEVSSDDLHDLIDELIELAAQHPGRFTQLALTHDDGIDESLEDHCIRTGVLAVAIAIKMHWSRNDVQLAGLAGMLSDFGMGLVPTEIRRSPNPLDEFAMNRVLRHPMFSVSLMGLIRGLPEPVRMAAYQHHERENGLGYPSGLRKERISDLGRVTAVAESFAAAIAPRPYRVDKRPYDALVELILAANEGQYSRRCVRALVEATGLFPVGSHILLNTGEAARVVSASDNRVDRPVVEPVSVIARKPIDLNQDPAVAVVRPIDPPRRRVIRREGLSDAA